MKSKNPRTVIATFVVASLALAACGSDSDSSTLDSQVVTTTTETPANTSPVMVEPDASTTTVVSTTATTVVSTSTSTSTSPPATTPSTTLAPAETRPDVDLALIDAPVDSSLLGYVLSGDVGEDELVETFNERLLAPTSDSGWQPMPADLSCTRSDEFREIIWSDLRIVLERTGEQAQLGAWSLGSPDTPVIAPAIVGAIDGESNVTTRDGVGLGSPMSSLGADYRILGEQDGVVIVLIDALVISSLTEDDVVVGIASGRTDCIDPDADL